jgi:hypothetical protein
LGYALILRKLFAATMAALLTSPTRQAQFGGLSDVVILWDAVIERLDY